jgi:hypothetical protein
MHTPRQLAALTLPLHPKHANSVRPPAVREVSRGPSLTVAPSLLPLPLRQVLSMLPDDLPLSAAAPLLAALLQHATQRARSAAVVRSLRRGQDLSAREDAVREKQRHVALTSDRACCMCHKRIGGSVLVAKPNGMLAHYLCFKRASTDSAGPAMAAAAGAGAAADVSAQGNMPGAAWPVLGL